MALTSFKNYEDARFRFSPQLNCIVGPNGSGKTNLLDAIYFLSLTKSAFHNQDALSIEHEAEFFLIDGTFRRDNRPVQITISLQRGQRKAVLSDKKPYDRLSEHIGRFPVVLLAPNDTDLVREHSEERRHFFDGVLSQLDTDYLRDYLAYQHILKQRNGLLKIFAEQRYHDEDLLETYNEPLLDLAGRIYLRRKAFIADFLPIVQKHYAYLSEAREAVDIIYESEVANDEFPQDFRRSRHRDIQLQRTTKGVHKDDYVFEANGVALKKFGSQGQQKTFVIALKLAQFEQLYAEKGIKPILLLDDIFDKLDDRRIGKLIELMEQDAFGQVFVTDARPERTQELLGTVRAEVAYFRTENNE